MLTGSGLAEFFSFKSQSLTRLAQHVFPCPLTASLVDSIPVKNPAVFSRQPKVFSCCSAATKHANTHTHTLLLFTTLICLKVKCRCTLTVSAEAGGHQGQNRVPLTGVKFLRRTPATPRLEGRAAGTAFLSFRIHTHSIPDNMPLGSGKVF